MNITEKSRLTSFILTLLLGPLGLLYSSVVGGVILCVVAVLTGPTIVGPLICWVLAIFIGDHCTYKHNKGVEKLIKTLKSTKEED